MRNSRNINEKEKLKEKEKAWNADGLWKRVDENCALMHKCNNDTDIHISNQMRGDR